MTLKLDMFCLKIPEIVFSLIDLVTRLYDLLLLISYQVLERKMKGTVNKMTLEELHNSTL